MLRWVASVGVLGVMASVISLNCGDATSSNQTWSVAASDKKRIVNPQVASQDLALQVAGNTRFALDLYGQLGGSGKNAFASPHSISTALAMAFAGASAQTEQEMAQALHFELPQDRLHPVLNKLDLELASRGQGAKSAGGGAFELSVANSIWARPDGTYLPDYLDLLAINYGAGVHMVDFGGDTEGARQAINAWVAQRTHDRIMELLRQGDIDANTAMVLVNAIYFNAAWAEPFEADMTSPEPFDAAGSPVTSEMMAGLKEEARYAPGDGYEAVELMFDGDELSMLVVVPDAGTFDAFREGLTAEGLDDILAALYPQEVYLKLPKFSFSSHVSLKQALEALGMREAFDPMGANFEGICGVPGGPAGMVISDVIHEAFVQVAEEGAEAAAATAVVFADAGAAYPPAEPVQLTVDRPFVFFIRDNATGTVLFVGHVVDPTA